jgi:hypothetical protein
MSLTIPIVSKDRFQEILLNYLVEEHKGFTTEDLFRVLLKDGFNKLDFDNLGKSLEKMFIYLPTMIVDIGNEQFCWIVSGNKAIVIDRLTTLKETENKKTKRERNKDGILH